MAKYCGKCGARLDEYTGACPRCDSFGEETPRRSPSGSNRRGRSGGNARGPLVLLIIALVVLLLLGIGVLVALEITDTVDIPVVEDLADGLIDVFHTKHKWKSATCTDPKTCKICGKTKGDPLGHVWGEADCETPQTCTICDEVGDMALGHDWANSTCTQPQTCRKCGTTTGTPSSHYWLEATYQDPETCAGCGATRGSRLVADPIWLVDLGYSDKYGKYWTWGPFEVEGAYHSNPSDRNAYMDAYTRGHVPNKVYDNKGNQYTNALWVDLGGTAQEYYLTYDLNGMYTELTGYCGVMSDVKNTTENKYVEIYCDGVLVYSSRIMDRYANPEKISIDVTGVEMLTIQYPATKGQNRIAALFDMKLE